MKLVVVGKDYRVALDLFVVCLSNMQVKERDDVVFFNSNCRGDYTTGNRSEFSLAQYGSIMKWRNQTFPMSKDGAVKIIESYTDEDYEEYIDLHLSKLDQKTTELLICASVYDKYFSLKDASSLNISLWRKNYIEEKMINSNSEWEIAISNNLWKEYNGCLDSYEMNLNGINSNAAVLGIIKRVKDQFLFEKYFKPYKNIVELVNDY